METTAIFNLLAEDKTVISYRKSFARLTGDPLAALLLQEIIYFWHLKERKPFYKFRAPCHNPLYKEGDAWTEELEWSVSKFDHALKIIGTKIRHGESKKTVLATDMPQRAAGESNAQFLARLTDALACMVIYWTDSNHVTWYQVNESLLAKFINRIYLDKFYGARYLENSILGDILKLRHQESSIKKRNPNSVDSSEDSSEDSTEEKILSPASADADGAKKWWQGIQPIMPPAQGYLTALRVQPFLAALLPAIELELKIEEQATIIQEKRKEELNAMFDAIKAGWGIDKGGWVGKLRKMLLGECEPTDGEWHANQIEPGMTAREVERFVEWYREETDEGVRLPEKPEGIQKWVYRFREEINVEADEAQNKKPVREEDPNDPFVPMPAHLAARYKRMFALPEGVQ